MKDRLMDKPNRPLARFRKMVNAGTITLIMTVIFALCFTLSYASAGGGEAEGGKNWSDFGWRAFDFAVLAGLLYWLLAGKVKEFFSGRQKSVKASLEKVEAAKGEAKRKFAEYDAKLDKAAEEIRDMAETICLQGLREKERIIADAMRAAEKMKEDVRKRMEQEMKKARNDLRTEAARLSIDLAQEILRKEITPTDHAGMVRDYIEKAVSRH